MKQEVQETIEILTKAFYNQLTAILDECTGMEKASNNATVYLFKDGSKGILDIAVGFEELETYEKGIEMGLYPKNLNEEMEA